PPSASGAMATASPVHNSPLQVDGSDAGGIGFSALPVRISGTPPREEIVEDHHTDSREVKLTLFDEYSTIIVWRTQPIFPSSRPRAGEHTRTPGQGENMSNGGTDVRKTGRCLCGSVSYVVSGPLRPVVACHCSQCRRMTGHFMAATAARCTDLDITSAE